MMKEDVLSPRFQLRRRKRGAANSYTCFDRISNRVVFESLKPKETVREIQRRNGFRIINGDERTLGLQVVHAIETTTANRKKEVETGH